MKATVGAIVVLAIAAGAYLWVTRPRGFNLQNNRYPEVLPPSSQNLLTAKCMRLPGLLTASTRRFLASARG
jgi:hypothetical protein